MHSGFRTSITAFNYLHIYIYNLKIQEVLILKCINFLLWNMSQQNCESYRTVTLVQARLRAEVFVKCSIACVPSREMRPLALSSCYIGISNLNHWGANHWTVMTTPKWLSLSSRLLFCLYSSQDDKDANKKNLSSPWIATAVHNVRLLYLIIWLGPA